MEIEFGSQVLDKNDKPLGTVDYIVRNTWTGEVSKFMVRRKAHDKDLFISPKDAIAISNSKIKLGSPAEELTTNT